MDYANRSRRLNDYWQDAIQLPWIKRLFCPPAIAQPRSVLLHHWATRLTKIEFISSQPIWRLQIDLQKRRLETALRQQLWALNKGGAFPKSAVTRYEAIPWLSISEYVDTRLWIIILVASPVSKIDIATNRSCNVVSHY
jgi:hypothetical protein